MARQVLFLTSLCFASGPMTVVAFDNEQAVDLLRESVPDIFPVDNSVTQIIVDGTIEGIEVHDLAWTRQQIEALEKQGEREVAETQS